MFSPTFRRRNVVRLVVGLVLLAVLLLSPASTGRTALASQPATQAPEGPYLIRPHFTLDDFGANGGGVWFTITPRQQFVGTFFFRVSSYPATYKSISSVLKHEFWTLPITFSPEETVQVTLNYGWPIELAPGTYNAIIEWELKIRDGPTYSGLANHPNFSVPLAGPPNTTHPPPVR